MSKATDTNKVELLESELSELEGKRITIKQELLDGSMTLGYHKVVELKDLYCRVDQRIKHLSNKLKEWDVK